MGGDVVMYFSLRQAADLAGGTPRQLGYWHRTGVLAPSIVEESQEHSPLARLYSFRDVVGLRTLAKLKNEHGFSLQWLRKCGEWLRQHYQEPWNSLKLYVVSKGKKKKLVFQDPASGAYLTAIEGQAVIPIDLGPIADEVKAKAAKLRERNVATVGRVDEKHRVIAGTKIRTAAIWEFHEDNHTDEQIRKQYPELEIADIKAAIAFEAQRRGKAA